MTVRRQAEQIYNLEPQALAAHVQRVLAENKEYQWEKHNAALDTFTTNVKPVIPVLDWFILGTKMIIAIRGEGQKSSVHAETISQPLVMGDAFAMYERYLRDFFARLQSSLERGGNATDVSGAPHFKRSANTWSLIGPILVSMALIVVLIYIMMHSGFLSFILGVMLFFLLIALSAVVQAIRSLHSHK